MQYGRMVEPYLTRTGGSGEANLVSVFWQGRNGRQKVAGPKAGNFLRKAFLEQDAKDVIHEFGDLLAHLRFAFRTHNFG